MNRILNIAFFFLSVLPVMAQVSSDCSNAVPICNNTPSNGGTNGYGVDDFNGAAKTGCLEQTTTGVIESNSAWYRFKTGASGELGFNISFNEAEDWDFALYKTNNCSDLGEPIRCNFFDNGDKDVFIGVGEDPRGVTNVQYDDWLQVEPGEEYYLLINNFSNINSGFTIQFSGQIFVEYPYTALDCSIIDNLLGPPVASCSGNTVILEATTVGATYNWYSDVGLGYQQITGQHNATLSVTTNATYRVEVSTITSATIISDVQVYFSTMPVTNTLTDVVLCQEMLPYNLSQKDSEALGGQPANEFIVSYHSSLDNAINNAASLPKMYTANPGIGTIYVRTTSLSNSNCYDVSEQFQLNVLETPTTTAVTTVFLCEGTTSAIIGETSPNATYNYEWNTGEITASLEVFSAGIYSLVITSNQAGQICKNSINIEVIVGQTPVISDVIIDDFKVNNTVTIVTSTQGDFEYKIDELPYQDSTVFTNVAAGAHTVTVLDENGCGFVTENIVVIGFPNYFSPNGDGVNDTWQIAGMSSLKEPVVIVFDRYGKLIKQLKNNQNWDGTFNGKFLPESDYWFKLSYVDVKGSRIEAKYINSHFTLKR